MNKLHDNDLDRLFAEKLEDLRVEPPEKSWKKVAAGITITTTISTTVLSNFIRPVLWTLSAITTSVVLTLTNPTSNTSLTNAENTGTPIIAIPAQMAVVPGTGNTGESTISGSSSFSSMLLAINTPLPQEPEQLLINASDIPATASDLATVSLAPAELLHLNLLDSARLPQLKLMQIQPFTRTELAVLKNPVIPYWFDASVLSGVDVFDFGNQSDGQEKALAFNSGIDLSFHFSDLYISTGSNFINLRQNNKYNYSVNEYAQVGEYTIVDSISFTQITDTLGQIVYIPQYYTSQHPYYDSVAVEKTTRCADQYRYMEIPIAIGFQKDIRRFSVFAQAGFSYSFLLSSKENTPSVVDGAAVQSWQSQSSERAKDLWSYSMSAGVLYNTNTHLSFGLSPTYRYCLSPLYSTGESTSQTPVSYGLRLRILYKF